MLTKEQALAALRTLQSSEATDEERRAAIKELEGYIEAVEEPVEDDVEPVVTDAEDGEQVEHAASAEDEGEETHARAQTAESPAKPQKKIRAADTASIKLAREVARLHSVTEQLQRERLIEKRTDLPPSLRQWCMTQPIGVVKSFLASHPRTHAQRNTTPTRGQSTPAGLEGRDREEMDRAMGVTMHSHTGPRRAQDGSLILPVVRPSDLRAQAQKGKD
jgi:hypothetical protein